MVWVLVGGPLAAPGIPRSLRSRPFRPTKGAECVLTWVLRWLFGWQAPLRPGHPLRTSLRSFASPYASRRGRLLLSLWVSGGWGVFN